VTSSVPSCDCGSMLSVADVLAFWATVAAVVDWCVCVLVCRSQLKLQWDQLYLLILDRNKRVMILGCVFFGSMPVSVDDGLSWPRDFLLLGCSSPCFVSSPNLCPAFTARSLSVKVYLHDVTSGLHACNLCTQCALESSRPCWFARIVTTMGCNGTSVGLGNRNAVLAKLFLRHQVRTETCSEEWCLLGCYAVWLL
jgi:hypothetical protein